MEINLTDKEKDAIIKTVVAYNGPRIEFNTKFLEYANEGIEIKVIREDDTIILTQSKQQN